MSLPAWPDWTTEEWIAAAKKIRLLEHMGPDSHPSGSPQSAHAGGGGSGRSVGLKVEGEVLARLEGVWKTDVFAATQNAKKWAEEGGSFSFSQDTWKKAVARMEGMSPDELRDAWREAIVASDSEILAQSDVAVAFTDRGLRGVLDDGRMKNQHETGMSGGDFSPDRRKRAELNGLGVPEDTPGKDRPIYGYARPKDGTLLRAGGAGGAGSYGWFHVVLKPEIRARSTYTSADSLGPMGWGAVVAAPVDAPHWSASDVDGAMYQWAHETNMADRLNYGYVEIQVHGGVKIKDISKVVIDSGAARTDWAKARLDELGIPWELTP